MAASLKLTYLGHSCFKIECSKGSLVCDPYDETLGYKKLKLKSNIVTKSHDHGDHNFFECVDVAPIDDAGFNLVEVKTFHDAEGGAKRGENTAYIFESEGLRVCHLGDLGHILTHEQVDEIGKIDALLVPVGGTYTITGTEAAEVTAQLRPNLVIPMHYKTDVSTLNISDEREFLKNLAGSYMIRYCPKNTFVLSKDSERGAYILSYSRS